MPDRKAEEIMDGRVLTLSPATDIYTAMRMLLKHKLSGAPVVDEQRKLIGILSEKDCLKVLTAEAFEGFPEGTVENYMTRPVATIGPGTSIYEIVHRFLTTPYRRLPVVDEEGCLLGQVSRADVLVAIASMRDNSYLYGTEQKPPLPEGEAGGVDSAMRRARGVT